jgi:hypothetical protein
MKTNLILLSAVAALGIITEVEAANTIFLTGSTAFRGNCYNVLNNNTNAGGPWDSSPAIDRATRGNSTPSKAPYMLFHGNINGTETFVSCFWSGSEAGIASVVGNSVNNNPFGPLPGAPAWFLLTDGSVPYTDLTASPGSSETNSGTAFPADLAMADTSIAVSLSSTFTAHDFGVVGIVPFSWVKNVQSSPLGTWSRLTDLSHPQIKVLLGFPQVAAFFTGNANDTSNYVYAVGRNKGSGTRVNSLADSGYGITKPVVQFSIGGLPFSGGLTLAEVDNNGYESGGDVAKALGVDGSQTQIDPNFGGTGWIAVGYLGVSDATGIGGTPTGNWLTLNGVMESDGAVEEGQYSLWGNEHLYGASGISGYKLTFGNNFVTLVGGQLGGGTPSAHSSGIQNGFMHAQKLTDTSVPTRL